MSMGGCHGKVGEHIATGEHPSDLDLGGMPML